MDEFELIRRYFAGGPQGSGVTLGIGDDGAVLSPKPGFELVAVTDTLLDAVHFPDNLPPEDIGYRCVAVNVSDIAAMGAAPRWMTLALTLSQVDEHWLERFSAGLRAAADEYGVALVGGDTTRGRQTTVTVQVLGEVTAGQALRRDGAQPGDAIFVSGRVGDAAAGLSLLGDNLRDSAERQYLCQRFARPTAHVGLGAALCGLASAAIDVSDGLLGDLKKLLRASGCGGTLELNELPLSQALAAEFGATLAERFALTGGDDYELCFSVPPASLGRLNERVAAVGESITRIGEVQRDPQLVCTRDGQVIEYDHDGYSHF